jgi:hypothetical protein
VTNMTLEQWETMPLQEQISALDREIERSGCQRLLSWRHELATREALEVQGLSHLLRRPAGLTSMWDLGP